MEKNLGTNNFERNIILYVKVEDVITRLHCTKNYERRGAVGKTKAYAAEAWRSSPVYGKLLYSTQKS